MGMRLRGEVGVGDDGLLLLNRFLEIGPERKILAAPVRSKGRFGDVYASGGNDPVTIIEKNW
jgi:hypothetical protein